MGPENTTDVLKPMFATFYELSHALQDLHLWNPAQLARLHDVWLIGAPSPRSIVRNPKEYDPRKKQDGNFEARLILPTKLAEWIVEVSTARGMPLTIKQATNMVYGEADYGAGR
jgi:hypothetical protein